MQTIVALVLMLQNFKYELEAEQMNKELEFDPAGFIIRPRSKINLRITNLREKHL